MKKLFASLILLCVMLVAKGAESDVNVAKGLVHRIAPSMRILLISGKQAVLPTSSVLNQRVARQSSVATMPIRWL